jgi:holo-[acyl-carrier protein] synthase
MGVVNPPSGQPTMQLTGGAQAFIHLTITDEGPLAQAFVAIEAR